MPYRYLEDVAVADAAFEAWGESIEEMIAASADATLNIMVGSLEPIAFRDRRQIEVRDAELDMLLFQALSELVYFKDAERLLLRVRGVELSQSAGVWNAILDARGETIDAARHDLRVDVKAITLHGLEVSESNGLWAARVVVDL